MANKTASSSIWAGKGQLNQNPMPMGILPAFNQSQEFLLCGSPASGPPAENQLQEQRSLFRNASD